MSRRSRMGEGNSNAARPHHAVAGQGELMARPRILVVDNGAFLSFGQALVPDADVLYFSTWGAVAPSSKDAMVGRDVPGIERVDSLWNYIDDVDVVAFPDIGFGDLQTHLRQNGYAVWGSGKAEMLEVDRWEFKRLLMKLGMPVVETRHVIGLDALRTILEKEDDLYVKTSFFRGDFESFHHVTWDLSEPWWQELAYRMGPHGPEMETLVEVPAPGSEVGFDGFVIDGRFSTQSAWGIECKDHGYIGQTVSVSDLPSCLIEANEVLAEPLRVMGARSCYSNEVRVTEDGTAYISDPACRCGAPPFAAMSLWITNWVEIVVAGASGDLVEPEYAAPFAAEIELAKQFKDTSMATWLEHQWLALEITPAALPWVRLRRPVVIDNRWWSIPHSWLDIVGSAVGLGETPEEAIDAALRVADQVKGIQLTYDPHIREELLDGWKTAQDACTNTPLRTATG